MYFFNSNLGIVLGYYGNIFQTIDGGINWTTVSSGMALVFYSTYFTDIDTGFVVGYDGTIMKTINGGATWNILSSGVYTDLKSVYFTSKNTGYAVGFGGTIIKTSNSGGFPVSVEDKESKNTNFTLYPNPADNNINIK